MQAHLATADVRALLAERRPLSRILVPLDGTLLSEKIFGLVRWIVAREETELVLLAVLPLDEAWSADDQDSVESTCDYLDWRRQLLASYPGRVRYAIRVGDPAAEIEKFAEEIEPSLVAMATHGRSGIDRWRHGSVTESLLQRTRFPVLAGSSRVLDAFDAPRLLRFHDIHVPLDGTLESGRVLPLVVELARLFGSVVSLVHASDDAEEANERLEPWRVAVAAAGVAVRKLPATGPRVATILGTARDQGADLVALTTRGHARIGKRLFLGSVAQQALRHGPCPVLVQRAIESPVAAGAATADDEVATSERSRP